MYKPSLIALVSLMSTAFAASASASEIRFKVNEPVPTASTGINSDNKYIILLNRTTSLPNPNKIGDSSVGLEATSYYYDKSLYSHTGAGVRIELRDHPNTIELLDSNSISHSLQSINALEVQTALFFLRSASEKCPVIAKFSQSDFNIYEIDQSCPTF